MTLQTVNTYEPLNESSILEVIKGIDYFSPSVFHELEVKEIGDGNLNLVFHIVHPSSKKGLIVKQALPYAKVVGESWPLTLDRARIESDALIKQAESVPQLVPKVLHKDHVQALTVLEDLSDHNILRKALIDGHTYKNLAKDIGNFTAHTAFFSSDFYLHPFEKKGRVVQFSNPELCKITEDLVFTDPFFDHDTNDFPEELRDEVTELWNDSELLLQVAELRYSFLTRAEVLLHGDLHTGSIFITDNSTKIIDPEFAFYGPTGFDLGQFFANLILNHLSQNAHAKEPFQRGVVQDYLLKTIEKTWHVFEAIFSELWEERTIDPFKKTEGVLANFLSQTLRDSVGFAGCEIIRRTIGLAHVADLDSIHQKESEIFYKQKALEIGSSLIKEHKQFETIEQLTKRIRGV